MSEPDRVDLWSLSDLCTPWCVHVAATLRIADHIAAGIHHIDDLALVARCNPYVLHRMLTYLVMKGVFEEPTPGQFYLNETARELLDPIVQLSLNLEGLGGRFAQAWGTLLKYVRTGQPAYQDVFGRTFWGDLDAHPDIRADFDTLMGPEGHGDPDPDFQITGGWESVRTVVDVGGGTGAMLAAILQRWPHLQGKLVDLPKTVALSPEIFQAAGVVDRVTAIGQSFFDPLPSEADLYLLRKVINDWPDREAQAILRRCAEAASPSSRIVVMGSVMPDDTPRPLMIEMVLLGGMHHSLSEFQALARQAGLEVSAMSRQPGGYFVVECQLI
jgi:2,7-dihydroxy-5-methyl-1-naphthoate 7-O-methyltransferase